MKQKNNSEAQQNMKNRLFKKFFFPTVFAVIISLAFIASLLSFAVGRYFAEYNKKLLKENCQTISQTVQNYIGSKYAKPLIQNAVDTLAGAIDSEVFITNINGRVLICSCDEWKRSSSCIHANGDMSENIINKAVKDEYYEVGRLSLKYSEVHYTYACNIKNSNNEVIAVVFASSPASSLSLLLRKITYIFVVCSIIPIVFLFCSIYFITYRLTKPLRIMSVAANKISMGDFSTRIPSYGNDEINDLAQSFNKMTDSLVKLEGTRRSFVANVSHELRTPMTTIGGFIDGIIDGTIEEDKRDYYLKIVSSEIKRLARIVQSMLSLARLESGEQEVNLSNVDLYASVCNSVISQEQRIEEKNISILGLEDAQKTFIEADEDLIYQVVYNLIDNAIKFVNEEGFIKFSFETKNDTVVLKIRNSGEGIKPQDLKYVFDRFYKVDKSRSSNKNSSGLGLYIVKTIVDIHKGKILVRSLYGEYTEFEVRFPINNKLKKLGDKNERI